MKTVKKKTKKVYVKPTIVVYQLPLSIAINKF